MFFQDTNSDYYKQATCKCDLQSATITVRLSDITDIAVTTLHTPFPGLRIVVLVLHIHSESLHAQSRHLVVGYLEVESTSHALPCAT